MFLLALRTVGHSPVFSPHSPPPSGIGPSAWSPLFSHERIHRELLTNNPPSALFRPIFSSLSSPPAPGPRQRHRLLGRGTGSVTGGEGAVAAAGRRGHGAARGAVHQ